MQRLVAWVALPVLIGLAGAMLLTSRALSAAEVGMVAPFNLAACPENWSPYSAGVGRVLVGVGTLGSDSYALGGTGGLPRVTLTIAEMPSHSHVQRYDVDNNSVTSHRNSSAHADGSPSSLDTDVSTASAGGGAAHENRQPYVALLFCERVAEDASTGGGGGDMACTVETPCVVTVQGTPSVTVSGTPDVNVANAPSVNVANTPTVSVSGPVVTSTQVPSSSPVWTDEIAKLPPQEVAVLVACLILFAIGIRIGFA